jgi:hypothetical protein
VKLIVFDKLEGTIAAGLERQRQADDLIKVDL